MLSVSKHNINLDERSASLRVNTAREKWSFRETDCLINFVSQWNAITILSKFMPYIALLHSNHESVERHVVCGQQRM